MARRTNAQLNAVHRVKVTYNKRPDQEHGVVRYHGPYDLLSAARGQATYHRNKYAVESSVVETLTGEWVADATKADA